jgi:hypothetical protein
MKRLAHRTNSFGDALIYGILQQGKMSAEERQKIARWLRRLVYGNKIPGVKESKRCFKTKCAF